MTTTPAEEFFLGEAGGDVGYARRLALAEDWLKTQVGIVVEWKKDWDYDPTSYDVPMPDRAFGSVLRGGGGVRASLWGVTFEKGKGPKSSPYARVVVAELALELMHGEPE